MTWETSPEGRAHFAQATAWKRLKLLREKPELARAGEVERLQKELAEPLRFNRPVHVSEAVQKVVERISEIMGDASGVDKTKTLG